MARKRRNRRDQRRPKGTGAAIYREERNAWYVRWRVAGKPVERKAGTEHTANRILSRVEDLVDDGCDLMASIRAALGEPEPDGDQLGFGALVSRYLDALERDGRRTPKNMTRERSRANSILKAPLHSIAVERLTRADVARWTEWLRRKRRQSDSTVNRCLALASSAWRWAQDFALTPQDRNPFREIRRGREVARDKGETLTPKEVGRLVAKASTDFGRLIGAAFQSACRPQELERVACGDVHLDGLGGHLRIRPENEKSGRGRRIPLTPALASVLREILSGSPRPLPTARVFLRSSCGRPWTARARKERWDRLLVKLTDEDIPAVKRIGLRFYDLRAAAITRMLGAGIPPAVVQRIAGHAHISTTARYVGQLNAEQQAAAAAIARALSA